MNALVGYTGFVGAHLAQQTQFDQLINSQNTAMIRDGGYDLVVYAGVRAEKYLANTQPQKDLEAIKDAIRNIERLQPRKLVLISTIDVYKNVLGVDENTDIDPEGLHAYGANRYMLEQWVRGNIKDHLVVRLPGLYGQGIKKNFIFDMIHYIPTMIASEKYDSIVKHDMTIEPFYSRQENGFYKLKPISVQEHAQLRTYFMHNSFNALCFTDSRASYQFYNLNYLWGHIELALRAGIRLLNLSTAPITAAQLYRSVTGRVFENILSSPVVYYDMRSIHADVLGGTDGYVFNAEFVLRDAATFIQEQVREWGELS